MVIHVELVTLMKKLNFHVFAKIQSGDETRLRKLHLGVKLKCIITNFYGLNLVKVEKEKKSKIHYTVNCFYNSF